MIHLNEIVGLNPDLEVFTGYDEKRPEASARNVKPYEGSEVVFMTKAQKQALADRMIALWTDYKERAE